MSPKRNEIEVVYRGKDDEHLDNKLEYLFEVMEYEVSMKHYDFLEKKKTIVFKRRRV